jgi:site-specific recombinase XerD
VFARLRKRVGISDSAINPQILRHNFALRYLQAGGNPQGLQELMGYEGMAPVRQYLRWYNQMFHDPIQKEAEEV